MEKSKLDKRQDRRMAILKPLVHIWMKFDMKSTYHFHGGFDPKRKEPYVLLGNHTFMFDVVHVPLPIKKQPFIIASHNLFVKQPTKFLLSKIAHAIPKTKSASDIRSARELIGAVRRGYPICIFPEGNTTFNGETTYIEESTMKLIKKLKIDVVTVHFKGGYLSKPRWATGKRKNRRIDLTYDIAIPKDKVKDLSLQEISTIINDRLYHNDYEYQRQVMIPHPGKELAEGLENILYVCPECQSFSAIETKGNEIWCNHCHTKGHVNKYGFIEGFTFDNTVEWDHWQRQFDQDLRRQVITSPCTMQLVDDDTFEYEQLGEGTITYKDHQFILEGDYNEIIDCNDIKTPIITLRRDFNFNVGTKHYLIKTHKYVSSFLRAVQEKY
ncbi:lysophospholipid acyltransferase family protein [Candidatus Xianfuyuplasma coldseepsis]|uniref:1-acyl-sn-glycerol-3-phosphate acyltransferase n=1 Tax=Candidatus Xianfuyuplasma coldseepsis TaxID=2782163 RepID=A0A7L7KPI5_9MOLU|nr:lysophospholipid acyltransferase family protein [Xianfuyuplasma coldseepsis]QMS84577.1 1-acyl-sn-glycerol-3-phosphate acyltransferase [Xianfuyuplasma coldseepsis]